MEEKQEFKLEDILKEFGEAPQEEPKAESKAEPEEEEVLEDLPSVEELEATRRIDPALLEKTRRMEPVADILGTLRGRPEYNRGVSGRERSRRPLLGCGIRYGGILRSGEPGGRDGTVMKGQMGPVGILVLELGKQLDIQNTHGTGDTAQQDHRNKQAGNQTGAAFWRPGRAGLVGIPFPGIPGNVVLFIHKRTSVWKMMRRGLWCSNERLNEPQFINSPGAG